YPVSVTLEMEDSEGRTVQLGTTRVNPATGVWSFKCEPPMETGTLRALGSDGSRAVTKLGAAPADEPAATGSGADDDDPQ
ncbi:MAG: hypothetical protein QNK37_32065, partial [Acidobacteriota bacterium]|nr:hypothetical protein [Acidobacteriota bacterium]